MTSGIGIVACLVDIYHDQWDGGCCVSSKLLTLIIVVDTENVSCLKFFSTNLFYF